MKSVFSQQSSRLRIVVLGYIVRGPMGGMSWHHLQYVLGLHQLGHEVLFVEDSGDFPSCYNPDTHEINGNPAYGLAYLKTLFDHFGLKENWAYFDAHQAQWYGLAENKVKNFCKNADILLNISRANPLREWSLCVPCRVFIDTDPAFTQIWNLTDEEAMHQACLHTSYFSFGENIGKQGCKIPSDGFSWKPTRQPVFLKAWKVSPSLSSAKWTTVMQWDSYKVREFNGQSFGMKSLSFKDFDLLPQKIPEETFELALGSPTAPIETLKRKGWSIISSLIPTKTPWSYQDYISGSKGEWSVAKHGYVISNSGWFSERSACYLASGRPVVVQDTGFSNILETGTGLLSFSSSSEAIDALEKVNRDYALHCKYAREIAEQHFCAEKVLTNLLKQLR